MKKLHKDVVMIGWILVIAIGSLFVSGCRSDNSDGRLFKDMIREQPASSIDLRYDGDGELKKKRRAEAVEAVTSFKLGVGCDYWAIIAVVNAGLATPAGLGLSEVEYAQVVAQTKSMYQD